MSLYANITLKTNEKTISLNDIQCGIADTLIGYFHHRIHTDISLNKEYQLNPVDVCDYFGEMHEVVLNPEGTVEFAPDDNLFYQSDYFFENKQPKQELQEFLINRYFLQCHIDETSSMTIVFL